MEIFITVMVFVAGMCAGSFINMLVYRTAKRYGVLKSKSLKVESKNRSFCDFCGRQLRWYENIPVVSWVIQGGRSRCCRRKLPVSYPLLELGMGILFVIANNQISINPNNIQYPIFNFQTIIGFIVVVLLVFSAVFDFRYMILPDFATVILVIGAIGYMLLETHGHASLQSVAAAVGAAGFLALLNILTRGKGMGWGDVKLAVFMGLFLGWPLIVGAFYIAFITGAVAGVTMILVGKAKRKTAIPFGPFLILGTLVAWWGQPFVIDLINRWF